MKKKNSANLLTEPINKLLFRLSAPIMLSALLRTSYDMVDIIFASRLGGLQVASIAFVGPLFMALLHIGLGLSLGGVSIIAKEIGKGDRERASSFAKELLLLMIILGILMTVGGLLFSDSLLRLLGTSGEFFSQASIYTKIRFLSLIFALLFQLYLSFYNSQGKMRMSLYMTMVGLVLNALLNTLLIYVYKMGIAGLAYATLLTQVFQALIIMVLYHREDHNFDLNFLHLFKKPNLKQWQKLLRVGSPLSFSMGSSPLGHLLINSLIVSFGYEVVAAFAIGNQINTIFWDPATAIGQSIVPLLAQNWGNRALERMKKIIRNGMVYTVVFSTVCAFLIQLVLRPVGSFLSKGDPIITEHVVDYIRVCGWGIIPWGIFQTFSGIFNSFQKTKATMIMSIIRLWGIRVPAVILLKTFLPAIGAYAVWVTIPLSNLLTVIAAIVLYYSFVPGKIFGPLEKPDGKKSISNNPV
ncbi:MAG: MATE family efflux transporter [Spirochaetales bacterium]|nr:MATE family efflux transporter [Spirochaetales bacterium]